MRVAGNPGALDGRERLSEHYDHLARLLRELHRPSEAASATLERQKLWPQNAADRLLKEPAFSALRSREDFKALLAELSQKKR